MDTPDHRRGVSGFLSPVSKIIFRNGRVGAMALLGKTDQEIGAGRANRNNDLNARGLLLTFGPKLLDSQSDFGFHNCMGGSNPYIQLPQIKKPTKKFKVKFMPMNVVIEVDPDRLPYGDTGLPGSLLDIAIHNGVDIDRACGGVCACSTCHVIVRKGFRSCNEAEDFELDRLDQAPGNVPESRLSCQACPDGSEDLEVEIPNWNRNLVREGNN